MNISILDGYALNPGDLDWSPLKNLGTLSIYDHTSPDQVVARSLNADIVITNKVQFDAQTLSQLPNLKCIVVTATGYNIIDTEAARQQGIAVCNAPNYSSDSVAQQVFALLLHITNRIADYASANRNGRWTASPDFCYIDIPTQELAGKTLGIIGFGNIGSSVAKIANAFGINVVTSTSKSQSQLPDYVTKVSIEQLLSTSHIISLHCALTPDTQNIINSAALAQIKPGTILINTSRGPLIDEQAVANALAQGTLAAYGADVLSIEPATAGNPLLTAPNSYLTPHIAWATLQARQRLMQITIDNVKAFCNHTPINVVN